MMDSLGNYLKAQREKKGIRLEEIASITKIHLRSLENLEKGQFKDLPPEPFIRGFITAYAKYIGLDPKDVMSRYRALLNPPSDSETVNENSPKQTPSSIPTPPLEDAPTVKLSDMPRPVVKSATAASTTPTPVPVTDKKETPNNLIEQSTQGPAKRVALVAGFAGLALVVGGLVYYGKTSTQNSTTQADATSAATSSPTVSDTHLTQSIATSLAKQAEGQAPPAPVTEGDNRTIASPVQPQAEKPAVPVPSEFAHEVVIEGKERTWIKVVVDEEAPIEYFLPEGETATYKAKQKIKVVLGNSAGSKVSHNGEPNAGVKFQGTIRSYIFPNDARFPQDVPSKRSPSSQVIDPE